MASIALLLSELLGGDSAGVMAAERYITGGGRLSPRELRPAVTQASPAAKQNERREEERDDLAASRIELPAPGKGFRFVERPDDIRISSTKKTRLMVD
ncbi:uncharacterized protein C2845_PM07G05920 [Panicum miliaceum]|uniref:Uncharacterized protein n=1 Tax=Panicum miliaceum TaxID=4540 RepID=A0A3L6SII4_PANMI|nr:uncharacterized protein C2845_PM07G05920 [Panicum miliaceum]